MFDVIERTPARLRDVPGIGPVRAERIAEAWQAQRVIRDIMVFLHSHGVGTSRAVRIYKTYGSDAIALIRENPYRLARDIRGIGFVTADRIAAKLGIEPHSMIRVRAGIGYVLAQALDDGPLRPAARGSSSTRPPVSSQVDADRVDRGAAPRARGRRRRGRHGGRARRSCSWPDCTPPSGHRRAPAGTGASVGRRGRSIDADKAIPWVEAQLGITLAERQRDALAAGACLERLLVITGGPGVGKTTLLQRDPARADGQGRRGRCWPRRPAARPSA